MVAIEVRSAFGPQGSTASTQTVSAFDPTSGKYRPAAPSAMPADFAPPSASDTSRPVNLGRQSSLGGERSLTIVARRAKHEAEAASSEGASGQLTKKGVTRSVVGGPHSAAY